MIMRIPKRRGVRNHDRPVSVLPERPMVGPAHAGNVPGQRGTLGWKRGSATKRADGFAHERAGTEISHKGDEVSGVRIDHPESGDRIILGTGALGEEADRFEADHRANPVTAGFALVRINPTPHRSRLE